MDRLNVNFSRERDDELMVRAAWFYYIGNLTQEETASRLGVNRSRIVRLLSEARERGLVTVTIRHDSVRNIELEQAISDRYALDFCMATPALGLDDSANDRLSATHSAIARRAVGSAAATFLSGKLGSGQPISIGVSWGRTIAELAQHLGGIRDPKARFVSLMGSLIKNSESNPFEVVQALAMRTGAEGYVLPVPFIVDSAADREVLMSQRSVANVLRLALTAQLYFISVGELTDTAILRRQHMISDAELDSVRDVGAVADTVGKLFDRHGKIVSHPLSDRMFACDLEGLRGRNVVLLGAGLEKINAIDALLRSGIIRGLIIDGDAALRLINGGAAAQPDGLSA